MIAIFILTVLLVAIVVLLWCLRGFTRCLKQQNFVGILVRYEETGLTLETIHHKSGSESRPGVSRNKLDLVTPGIHPRRHASVRREGGYRSYTPADVA
ncbi:MAG TPA: hypothetical protein VHA33_29925 [Candidatus Angelobacter sp.]|jgi:hypothetical protein|nr:hypothetical protein [Candidatus Angelobacter sp.]